MNRKTAVAALLFMTGLSVSFAEDDNDCENCRQGAIAVPVGSNQQGFFQQQQQQAIIFNPNAVLPPPQPTPNPLLQLFRTLALLRLLGFNVDAFDSLFGGILGSSKFDFEDEGWYEASNNCWYEYFTDLKNYRDAQDACKKNGGARLASKGIYTQDIRNELVDNSFVFPNNWDDPWIGLDDIEEENSFIWSDDTTIATDDQLWPGEGSSAVTGNGDCVVLNIDNVDLSVITDQSCGQQEHYLCEYCPS